MTPKEYVAKNCPLPWKVECLELMPTNRCHHKTRTWIVIDANGRRVWWTEKTVAAICEVMNANANAAPAANAVPAD